MEVIIVTGLSGAGKSQAMNCIEDLGYYCVDNMPPKLINEFITLAENNSEIDKAAFVVDIRQGSFFKDLNNCLEELKANGREYRIMFLEASDRVLIRRYKETRRSHPLSKDSITAGIKEERERLETVRDQASYIIDTSAYKTADLNEEIKQLLSSGEREDSFTITVMSFGFKHGIPVDADWVLDARFIPNPYYIPSLKKLTGNNKKIREFVMRHQIARDFTGRVVGLALDLIPGYIQEGKYNLVLAIGCTGGHHRSVAIANELYERFTELGKHTVVIHRDL
ncbi:MAG: RNase adapter RapZ [Clostridia bacterium]|nr:RNase adapter RapZ [Clostridia bacterium]